MPARTKLHRQQQQQQPEELQVFFYQFLVSKHFLEWGGSVVFPPTYFFALLLFLDTICIRTREPVAYRQSDASQWGSKGAIRSCKTTLEPVASFQDTTYWSQTIQVAVLELNKNRWLTRSETGNLCMLGVIKIAWHSMYSTNNWMVNLRAERGKTSRSA